MPPEFAAFPADFWVQPTGGEFLAGVFRDPEGRDALYIANHSAHMPQAVTLRLPKPMDVFRVDRETCKWVPVYPTAGVLHVTLDPGGGELLRFKR